jgi:signal peptidase
VQWTVTTFLLLCATALAAVVLLGPYRVFAVQTGSMSPTIPPRSAVVVDSGGYQVGDVISFRHEGGVITHRLVKEDDDGGLHTRGDANDAADPWTLHASDVIGQVVAAPQHLGYWLVYLKNPMGTGSVLLCAVALWLVWTTPTGRERREPREDLVAEPA